MRKLLKKKAFTLIEVIIAMAIMTILIVAAMSMFNPVNGIVKSLDEDTVTNAVTDTITNYVTDKLKNASTYNIKEYKTEDLTKNSDVDSSVAKIASVMFADKELNETVYCMILRSTAEGISYTISASSAVLLTIRQRLLRLSTIMLMPYSIMNITMTRAISSHSRRPQAIRAHGAEWVSTLTIPMET